MVRQPLFLGALLLGTAALFIGPKSPAPPPGPGVWATAVRDVPEAGRCGRRSGWNQDIQSQFAGFEPQDAGRFGRRRAWLHEQRELRRKFMASLSPEQLEMFQRLHGDRGGRRFHRRHRGGFAFGPQWEGPHRPDFGPGWQGPQRPDFGPRWGGPHRPDFGPRWGGPQRPDFVENPQEAPPAAIEVGHAGPPVFIPDR
jgi:hypothetical protein